MQILNREYLETFKSIHFWKPKSSPLSPVWYELNPSPLSPVWYGLNPSPLSPVWYGLNPSPFHRCGTGLILPPFTGSVRVKSSLLSPVWYGKILPPFTGVVQVQKYCCHFLEINAYWDFFISFILSSCIWCIYSWYTKEGLLLFIYYIVFTWIEKALKEIDE